MAAYSKQEKAAVLFKQRLDQLDCPFTEGVEESWVTELLFSPGEPRIRLLQWLFSRLDPKLNDVLDPQFSSVAKIDSRLQRLLFVASTLGLCASDDTDLIKGTCSVSKQTSFMTQLLDIVYTSQEAEEHRGPQAPGIVGPGVPLKQQFIEDTQYVNMLAAEIDTKQFFAPSSQFLPPDISRLLQRNRQSGAKADTKELETPDLQALREKANECEAEIERQNERLQSLMQEFSYPLNDDAATQSKVQTTLRLALTELQQLMMSFSQCFELEMRAWCNKERPHVTELGAQLQCVRPVLEDLTQLLSSIASIREQHGALCSQVRSDLEKLRRSNLANNGVGLADQHQVEEYVNILNDSMARLEFSINHTQSTLPANLTISTIKSDS